MIAHGTKLIGENHPSSKLTWEIAKAIRSDPRRGKALYAAYPIASPRTIRRVRAGERWAEVA